MAACTPAEAHVLAWDIGVRTLSFCAVRFHRENPDADADADERPLVTQWGLIDILAENAGAPVGKGSNKASLQACNDALVRCVASRAHLLPHLFDAVIIEQQPAGGNNRFSSVRMKALSHALYTYYYVRRMDDAENARATTLAFVSPSIKLRGLQVQRERQGVRAAADGRKRYKENKQYAVEQTVRLMGLARVVEAAGGGSKHDDVCDAFMLAYEYLRVKRRNKPTQQKPKAPKQ